MVALQAGQVGAACTSFRATGSLKLLPCHFFHYSRRDTYFRGNFRGSFPGNLVPTCSVPRSAAGLLLNSGTVMIMRKISPSISSGSASPYGTEFYLWHRNFHHYQGLQDRNPSYHFLITTETQPVKSGHVITDCNPDRLPYPSKSIGKGDHEEGTFKIIHYFSVLQDAYSHWLKFGGNQISFCNKNFFLFFTGSARVARRAPGNYSSFLPQKVVVKNMLY